MAEAEGTAFPGGPGWGDLRLAVLAAVSQCEAAVAGLRDAPRGDIRPFRAAQLAHGVLQDLAAQVTRMAWDEEIAGQEVARAASRAFGDGYAAGARAGARRRLAVPRQAGPRPPWPRVAGD